MPPSQNPNSTLLSAPQLVWALWASQQLQELGLDSQGNLKDREAPDKEQ